MNYPETAMSATKYSTISDWRALAEELRGYARELGFQDLRISDVHLGEHETHLRNWLAAGRHGTMTYMEAHGDKRSRPAELVPGTLRILSARMDYLPVDARCWEVLRDGERAYIARYALGRDYHRLMRKRLQQLAERIQARIGPFGYRAFVDSAPVLEKAVASQAGLGWIGKNTLLLNRKAGSFFFLGELFTDLPLPADITTSAHCGSCHACLDICPTQAIVAPYQLDARRCISYLTIESKAPIPLELRPLIGNRIFGCDDCQLVCPWNRYAKSSQETDFIPRHGLDQICLLELAQWDETRYLTSTEGSPLRRIGFEGFMRNVLIGLGNAPYSPLNLPVLKTLTEHTSPLIAEHARWALAAQQAKAGPQTDSLL